MSSRQRLVELLTPVVEQEKYEFVDLQYKKEGKRWVIRLFIDKPGGIGVEDCSKTSQKVSFLLDNETWLPQGYVLEVSSPGIDRPLHSEKDYLNSVGSKIKVKLYESINNQKRFIGKLLEVKEDKIVLELENSVKQEIEIIKISYAARVVEI